MSIKYNQKIGRLQIFKPDYVNDNKKTLITSDIIKEYLRKRKGKKFYKVSYLKNNFVSPEKQFHDIINRNIQLKIIQSSYQEMKKQSKRRIKENGQKNNNEIKLITSKDNNNKRSKNTFVRNKTNSKNTFISVFYNSILYGYKRNEKLKKFRKIKSEENYELKNKENELYSKKIVSYLNNIIKNNGISINKNCKSPIIRKIYKYNELINKNNKNYFNNTDSDKNKDEYNYISLNQEDIINTLQDIKKYLTHNNISNNDSANNDLINSQNRENNNPYFYPIYKNEDFLKKKYNFFRISPEKDDFSFNAQKFKKVKKILDSNKQLEIKKLHPYYVYHFLKNIKRQNLDSKLNDNIISSKIY